MSSKKIQNLQGLRGIAVLLVVFFHMLLIERKYAQFDTIVPNSFMIGVSGVDLFFLISGFVMVTVTRDIFQSQLEIWRFLYHRVTRIYPLYWFYSIIILCVFIVHPSWVNSNQGNQVNILESFLLIPQNILPLVNVGWTLIHEIYFYIVFTALLFFPRKSLLYGLISWAIIIFFGDIYLPWENSPFIKVYFHPLTIEFIVGCLMAILYFKNSIKGNANFIALTSLTIWVIGYYLYKKTIGEFIPSGWIRVLVFGVPCAFGLYAALLYEKNDGIIMPKWICKVGDYSYSIYLSHIIVLSVIGRFWSLFAFEGYWDNIFMLLIMSTSVVITGYISYRFIEKVMLDKSRAIEQRFLSKIQFASYKLKGS